MIEWEYGYCMQWGSTCELSMSWIKYYLFLVKGGNFGRNNAEAVGRGRELDKSKKCCCGGSLLDKLG